MLREYRKINVHLLEGEHCLATPQPNFEDLTLDSPATALMVDFNLSKPITAADNISTSDALELMRTNHVRMLIIVNKPGEFSGIVTAMDLMGRKPIMYASQAGIAYANVMVKNVMTHKDHIHAISLTDVEKASLGDVITTLNSLHEQHILILDEETEPKTICGLLSASDFKRALGIDIDTTMFAHSFSDLVQVIHKHREVG